MTVIENKILRTQIISLALENNDYDPVTDIENDDHYMVLYLKRKSSESQGWIDFYKTILSEEDIKKEEKTT